MTKSVLTRRLTSAASLVSRRMFKNKGPRSAIIYLHGNEAKSLGGPSLRAPKTAQALSRLGIEVSVNNFPDAAVATADIVHGFNVWTPESSLALARQMRALGRCYVFSPIFLDLSDIALWHNALPVLMAQIEDPDALEDALVLLKDKITADLASGNLSAEPFDGYHAMVREIISLSDHIILLSECERKLLTQIGAQLTAATLIRNPVDVDLFSRANGTQFEETYGIRDYVLCVARIESRKNQVLMLHALRDLNVPIVLMGHAEDKDYERIVRRYAKDNVHLLGWVDQSSGLVASAMAGARVVVLPSWSEGAPLAALQAGATGASLVLSNRSGEQEYFGDQARYCDPGDLASMRRQILCAYESPFDSARREELKHFMRRYGWDRYAAETLNVYRSAFDRAK